VRTQPISKAAAFSNWNYRYGTHCELILGHPNGLQHLRFGPAIDKFDQVRAQIKSQSPNLVSCWVPSSEFLASVDGTDTFAYLQNWTNVETPEIAVQYRSPRISHFLSIWKQTTQVKGKL
jgi:hypothetical protein